MERQLWKFEDFCNTLSNFTFCQTSFSKAFDSVYTNTVSLWGFLITCRVFCTTPLFVKKVQKKKKTKMPLTSFLDLLLCSLVPQLGQTKHCIMILFLSSNSSTRLNTRCFSWRTFPSPLFLNICTFSQLIRLKFTVRNNKFAVKYSYAHQQNKKIKYTAQGLDFGLNSFIF